MNGIFLCLEGIISDDYLLKFNYFFTSMFSIEMFFKIIGLGIKSYIRDNFNIMDAFIVFFSVAEILLTVIVTSSFQSLRVLRSIRVFRIFRILRSLEYIKRIANFIYKSFSSFIYIASLLLLFNFVYGLLGMDLFTNITLTDLSYKAYSFDDFSSSFMCAFDLLTLDNWSNILIVGMNSDAGIIQTAIYSISWIFIGNYILMNLFLAVLLDGLTNELIDRDNSKGKKRISGYSGEKVKEVEIYKKIFEKEMNNATNNNNNQANINQGNINTVQSPQIRRNSKNPMQDAQSASLQRKSTIQNNPIMATDMSMESLATEISHKMTINELRPNDVFYIMNSQCDYSLFIFSKCSRIRIFCHKIVFHSAFESIILIIIMICSVKMIVDTYENDSTLLLAIDNITTGVFVIECLMKIIAKGFIVHQDTYLRESWNQLDFLIVVTSVITSVIEQMNIPFMKVNIYINSYKYSKFLQFFKYFRIPYKFL